MCAPLELSCLSCPKLWPTVFVSECAQVRLGPNGAEEILPIGELSAYEQKGLEEAKELLAKNIAAGIKFAKAAAA